jgi:hypothetical protein
LTDLQLDTWALAPIGGAILVDTLLHSIPGINILFSLLAEPVGAACGVAYMMTLVLSAPAVDPNTLAPKVGWGCAVDSAGWFVSKAREPGQLRQTFRDEGWGSAMGHVIKRPTTPALIQQASCTGQMQAGTDG